VSSIFQSEHRVELAAGIPNARLRIVERAGLNAHAERPAEVMEAVLSCRPAKVDLGPASASVSSR
jgi:hypothetical protein